MQYNNRIQCALSVLRNHFTTTGDYVKLEVPMPLVEIRILTTVKLAPQGLQFISNKIQYYFKKYFWNK